eukprot:TRINITY_DN16841_c0_g1_i2.p1 TRINITY_DN16841_c0_g1~~TRINITY_DN16841_c0_g1_i2.p1  ORF type:complete len:324 (-),score=63.36 TRINITY_DN16841_c0_g1_i2:20-991(-)
MVMALPRALTLRLCCDSQSRGYAFPVPRPQEISADLEDDDPPDEFSINQGWATRLLPRAAEKLGFNLKDLVALQLECPDANDTSDERGIEETGNLKRCSCGSFALCSSASWLDDVPSLLQPGLPRTPVMIVHIQRVSKAHESGDLNEPYPSDQLQGVAGSSSERTLAAGRKSLRKCQTRISPRSLRNQALALRERLKTAGIYVPPLPEADYDDDASSVVSSRSRSDRDRYALERHGHGRGNTKSTKKRHSKENKEVLSRFVAHLEALAIEKGVDPDVSKLKATKGRPQAGKSRNQRQQVLDDAESRDDASENSSALGEDLYFD